MNINKWAQSYLFRENIVTVLSLTISVMMFYFIPFIIKDYKIFRTKILNFKSLISIIILILILFFFFEYNRDYSGGIILKFSKLIFNNHIIYYLTASIFILIFYFLFFDEKKKFKSLDTVLIITLFALEIDGVIYHETFDPLLIILITLLFKNRIINNFILNLNYKNFFSILIFFYILFNGYWKNFNIIMT